MTEQSSPLAGKPGLEQWSCVRGSLSAEPEWLILSQNFSTWYVFLSELTSVWDMLGVTFPMGFMASAT